MAAAPPLLHAANAVLELIRSGGGARYVSSGESLNLQVKLSSDDVPIRVEISGKAIRWSSRFHTAGQASRGTAAGVFFDMPWNRLALAAAIALAAIVASSFLPRLRQPGADLAKVFLHWRTLGFDRISLVPG